MGARQRAQGVAAVTPAQQARVTALANEVETICQGHRASVIEILSLAGAMIVRQAEHPQMTPTGRKAIVDLVDRVRAQVVDVARRSQ